MKSLIYDYNIKFCPCAQKAGFFPILASKSNLCKHIIFEYQSQFDDLDILWMPTFIPYQSTLKAEILNASVLRKKFFNLSYLNEDDLLKELFIEFSKWIQYISRFENEFRSMHQKSILYSFFIEHQKTILITRNIKNTLLFFNPFITYWCNRKDLIKCLKLKKYLFILPFIDTWDTFLKFKERLIYIKFNNEINILK
jgi:hypothetical protein